MLEKEEESTQSFCLNTQYLPGLLCCLGQSSLICIGTCWLCSCCKKRWSTTYLLLRVHLGNYTCHQMKCSQVFLSVYVWLIFTKSGQSDASCCATNNYRWWIKCKHYKLSPFLQHRIYKPVDQSGTVIIKAWNQSKTKGMPKTSANNPCETEAGISLRLGKMNAVSYWLLAEHPQVGCQSNSSLRAARFAGLLLSLSRWDEPPKMI